MPQIINHGSETLRINPQTGNIDYSTNGSRSWGIRCNNSTYGKFIDLLSFGSEVLACTSRGLYASTNAARSFSPRCVNTSSYGDFLNLQADGNYLLANTTKGLYYSTNKGASWVRR
ncbi:MAG: hypothetical protein ACOYJG_07930 [Prevotella sp.]|jgi:hypothetical protein